jgi:membrane-bound lytic murein transglycosylase B
MSRARHEATSRARHRHARAWRRWPIAIAVVLALPAGGAATDAALDAIVARDVVMPAGAIDGRAAPETRRAEGSDRAQQQAASAVIDRITDALRDADAPVVRSLAQGGIPDIALLAYVRAQDTLAVTDPGCGLRWSLLAAIGRVESNHGRYGGAELLENGDATRPIRGIPLDGRPGVALIRDTDGGASDGDAVFDRAVGPMQFIPSTWRAVAADGNGDGRRDPNNIFDAALAAGTYLCAGDTDLGDPAQRAAAVLRYNRSHSYVQVVLALADAYEKGRAAPLPSPGGVPAGTRPVPLPLPPANPGPPLALEALRSAGQAAPPPIAGSGGGSAGVGTTQGSGPSVSATSPSAPSGQPAGESGPEIPDAPTIPGPPDAPTPPDEPATPRPPAPPTNTTTPEPPAPAETRQPDAPEEPEEPEEPAEPEEPEDCSTTPLDADDPNTRPDSGKAETRTTAGATGENAADATLRAPEAANQEDGAVASADGPDDATGPDEPACPPCPGTEPDPDAMDEQADSVAAPGDVDDERARVGECPPPTESDLSTPATQPAGDG